MASGIDRVDDGRLQRVALHHGPDRLLEIASQLDVDKTVVEKLEGWLERYEALLEEVQVILEG